MKNPENRESEPWVLEAITYLHHPLRQSTSIKYVGESLSMIEEIQETGDIFFPARWLTSILGRYNSNAVAQITKDYLSSNSNLSPKLRDKILQSADMVFRASEINAISN